jgi:uncharacterized protein (TIGR02145 family)
MKRLYKNYLIIICVVLLSILSTKVNAQHFNFEGGDPFDPFWTLYIAEATLNNVDLVAGDEIAIFDGELMVGAITLTQVCTPDNQFENVLLAFNTLASGNTGYTPGNNALFKCWDASLEIEITDFEISFDNPYGDAWTQNVFPSNNGEYSIVHLNFSWVQVGNLGGIITNAANSLPIEGVLVTVEGTSFGDITASDGTYFIEDVETGTYSVKANAEGYFEEIIIGVGIYPNETTTLDVAMNAIPGIIAGTVINFETMEAIAGATIIVEGTIYTTTSDSNGEYTIEDVEPGTYHITASAEDYFSLTIYNQTVIYNQTTIVDFIMETVIQTQTYNLVTGYQFVSSRLITENPDMQNILYEVLDNLDFVRNSAGYMLRKIGPMWVNSIGDWVTTEGYLIKMNAPDSFEITGEKNLEWTPINLSTGYQIISYLPSEPRNCEEVFTNILDNLDFVRNTDGFMFRKIGPVWVNSIGDMQPGEGYLVKMNAEDVLSYILTINCGEPLIDPRDGQFYNTLQIGTQCWVAENLNIGEMINGNSVMSNNSVIEKYCYDNDPANCETYGGLYQWNEMMEYSTTPGVQGICLSGWHLPTDDEWKILEGTVDSQYPVGDPVWNNLGLRGYDVGLNLKSTTGWYGGGNGSGLYNYEALPGGYCNGSGGFGSLTSLATFWSSSEDNGSEVWHRDLHNSSDEVYRDHDGKYYGFSVRCVQD